MQVYDATLITSENGATFKLSNPGKLWITVTGTFSGGTVTMQQSFDKSSWIDFVADGSAVTFTTNDNQQIEAPDGYYRLIADGTVTTVAVRMSGDHLRLTGV